MGCRPPLGLFFPLTSFEFLWTAGKEEVGHRWVCFAAAACSLSGALSALPPPGREREDARGELRESGRASVRVSFGEVRAVGEMDPDAVAKAFVEHYYRTFDTNRAGLGNLYQDGSMLTFEGAKTQGSQAIVAKLTSLPFQQCHHNVSTVDCQPSGPAGGVLVFVSGTLQLAGEHHALKFSQFPGYMLGLMAEGFYWLRWTRG